MLLCRKRDKKRDRLFCALFQKHPKNAHYKVFNTKGLQGGYGKNTRFRPTSAFFGPKISFATTYDF